MAEAQAFGLTLDQIPEDECDVWPENWSSFCVFESMSTQWRSGGAGPTGLDYAVIPSVLRLSRVPAKDGARVFEDVRVMELEALKTMARERDSSS